MTWDRIIGATAVASIAAFGAHLQGQSATSTVACTVADIQQKAPADTTITGASVVEAQGDQPRHCRVDGQVASPGNQVNLRIGLPERWNGKFLFIGVGGLGGQIGQLGTGLARGYATASTDTGHVSSDPVWGLNRAKEIDYGHRGTHVTAVAGQALTTSFYGRSPEHAYFNGCSNGGRQALMEVQRYPSDFDGIIAGDPATGTPMQAGRALVFQKLLASSESYLTVEKVELLSRSTLAACDAADGLKDGLLSDPSTCHFTPQTLLCKGVDGPNCLTAPQLDVVQQIQSGVKLPNGDTYAYGFPPGHEGDATGWRAWISGRLPPEKQPDGTLDFKQNLPNGFTFSVFNFKFMALDDDDPMFSWRAFRLDRDLPRMKIMSDILSPLDSDLRPFRNRGGKLLMYHGGSDPAISPLGTIDYLKKVGQAVGGQRELDAFARLYLVPGMHHCSDGPGPNEFDELTALEDWVEKGVAPASILASHSTNGIVDRTRPLCPYPQVATYLGTGSIDEAANFSCQAPPAP